MRILTGLLTQDAVKIARAVGEKSASMSHYTHSSCTINIHKSN